MAGGWPTYLRVRQALLRRLLLLAVEIELGLAAEVELGLALRRVLRVRGAGALRLAVHDRRRLVHGLVRLVHRRELGGKLRGELRGDLRRQGVELLLHRVLVRDLLREGDELRSDLIPGGSLRAGEGIDLRSQLGEGGKLLRVLGLLLLRSLLDVLDLLRHRRELGADHGDRRAQICHVLLHRGNLEFHLLDVADGPLDALHLLLALRGHRGHHELRLLLGFAAQRRQAVLQVAHPRGLRVAAQADHGVDEVLDLHRAVPACLLGQTVVEHQERVQVRLDVEHLELCQHGRLRLDGDAELVAAKVSVLVLGAGGQEVAQGWGKLLAAVLDLLYLAPVGGGLRAHEGVADDAGHQADHREGAQHDV
mmetsp:Transcript_11943/g.31584  ORF Transcript_11943/g.31584 Transcript_11943/m.31584 type:complete len:365 (-) Transcript_11943:1071-2165(-)